jgi:MinD-like ATPase involved in chromosome partitioning or flagellar assembly
MEVVAVTQVAGGVGATVLAANLTNLWPVPNRVLMELGITGGSLMRVMGFENQLGSAEVVPSDIVKDGYDLGTPDAVAPKLAELEPEHWELPVLPAPGIPDFPRPGNPFWWQQRVELALDARLDVIVDLGVVAPEHLGIHNRVLNAASVVLVVVRTIDEARHAVARLSLYRDRLALVVVSRLRSLPEEITQATEGVVCAGVLPFDDDITRNLWRNMLVMDSKAKKPSRQYLEEIGRLATYLRGDA